MGYQKVTGSTVGLSSAMKSCMRPATVPMKTMKPLLRPRPRHGRRPRPQVAPADIITSSLRVDATGAHRTTPKNSAVEGEHEKRDHKAHAGQCNCDLNHPKSIDDNFLMPGELLQAPPNRNSASLKPNAAP